MKNMLILATEYKALKARENALKAEMDALKAEMIKRMEGAEKVVCGQYTIQNQTIVSNVFDTKRFETENPKIAEAYKVEKTTSRFTVR